MGLKFDLRNALSAQNTTSAFDRGLQTYESQEMLNPTSILFAEPVQKHDSGHISNPWDLCHEDAHMLCGRELLSTFDVGYLSELVQAFPTFTNVELYFASLGNASSFPSESDWLEERDIDTQERTPRD
jgi:hypothetical protein